MDIYCVETLTAPAIFFASGLRPLCRSISIRITSSAPVTSLNIAFYKAPMRSLVMPCIPMAFRYMLQLALDIFACRLLILSH